MSSTVTASARLFTEANSEYFSITNAAQAGLGLTTGAYIRGFVYLTETASTDGNNLRLVTKWNTTSDQRSYSVYIASSDNKLNFSVSSDGTAGTVVTVASTTALSSTATWYLFEAYYDGVNIGVSVNNETFVTSAFSAGIYNSTAIFAIGQDGNLGAGNLGGRACTISVYSADPGAAVRTALYNSGNGTLHQSLTAGQKTGLVSWWDGVETSGVLIDAHGTNHLTDNNTVTSAAGKVTYTAEDASQFTAANSEYLSISDASQSGLSPGNTDYYWCGWVYMDSLGVQRGLVAQWGSATPNNDWLIYVSSANRVRLIVSSNGGTSSTTTPNDDDTLIRATGWFFFEGWHDATNDIIGVQLNRSVQNTIAYASGIGNNSAAFTVGSASAADYMNGRLANVVAISGIPTTGERDAIYNRGFGVHHTDRPALSAATYVSWWPLDEASGTRVDVIGNNDLTDNNTVTGNPGVVYDAPAVSSTKKMMLLGVG